MPKTLTVDDTEISTLQHAIQRQNADYPHAAGLATLTPKIAALSDPEPAPAPSTPAAPTK